MLHFARETDSALCDPKDDSEFGENMKKPTRADAFAMVLSEELNRIMEFDKDPRWNCDAALFGRHERADVRLKCWGKRKAEVLIEVELRRGNPAVNALKIWLWARDRKDRKIPVVLVHALSCYYRRGGSSRAKTWSEHMDFVAARIKEDRQANLTYLSIPFGYCPKRHACGIGGAGRRWARRLASTIKKRLGKLRLRTRIILPLVR